MRCRQLRDQGRQRHLRRHTHTRNLAGAIQSVQTCLLHAATCPVLIVLRHCCLQRPQRRQRVCLRLGVCGLAERVLHAEGRTPILRDWLGGGELCTGTIGRQRREPHCTTVGSVARPAAVPESCLAVELFTCTGSRSRSGWKRARFASTLSSPVCTTCSVHRQQRPGSTYARHGGVLCGWSTQAASMIAHCCQPCSVCARAYKGNQGGSCVAADEAEHDHPHVWALAAAVPHPAHDGPASVCSRHGRRLIELHAHAGWLSSAHVLSIGSQASGCEKWKGPVGMACFQGLCPELVGIHLKVSCWGSSAYTSTPV